MVDYESLDLSIAGSILCSTVSCPYSYNVVPVGAFMHVGYSPDCSQSGDHGERFTDIHHLTPVEALYVK